MVFEKRSLIRRAAFWEIETEPMGSGSKDGEEGEKNQDGTCLTELTNSLESVVPFCFLSSLELVFDNGLQRETEENQIRTILHLLKMMNSCKKPTLHSFAVVIVRVWYNRNSGEDDRDPMRTRLPLPLKTSKRLCWLRDM